MNIRTVSEVVCDLGEGPIWNAEENTVIWTDITQKIFYVADLDMKVTIGYRVPAMIGAIALTRDKNFIAATQEGFAQISSSGEFSPLHSFLTADMRMNDGKVDPAGRFWAGSLAFSFEIDRGSLYVLNKDGSYRTVLNNLTLSNGMAWSLDHKYFYLIESIPGVLKRFDYDHLQGEISNPIDLITFDTSMGIPDGMCLGSNGEIFVALWDGGRIEIYEPTGVKISEILLEVSRPTSCTFAGEKRDVLIVTTSSLERDLIQEPLAGKTLAISETGWSGPAPYVYG